MTCKNRNVWNFTTGRQHQNTQWIIIDSTKIYRLLIIIVFKTNAKLVLVQASICLTVKCIHTSDISSIWKERSSSSSSRSPTGPVQQHRWSWWSSSGPHIISCEAELLMATVRFALVGVCYISEEHARLSGPPHHRDTLGEGTIFSFLCMCALTLLWPERSRAKTTWPGMSRRWYASFSCLGFSAVLMMVVFSW